MHGFTVLDRVLEPLHCRASLFLATLGFKVSWFKLSALSLRVDAVGLEHEARALQEKATKP